MHHVILGAGGIGGLMGACLAHAGEHVTLVVRESAVATFPDRICLESTFGTFNEPVDHTAVAPSGDVLWVTVKATQLEQALRSVPQTSSYRGVVPLLNGTDHVERLRARFGREVVIPATIAVESERVAPGRISQPSPFCRLSVAGQGRQLLEGTLEQLQKIGFVCRFVDSEATLLWQKLVFLAPIALSTTAVGGTIGDVVSNAERRKLLEESVKEACAIAAAEGAKVDPKLTFETMASLPGGMRSSMQKDVQQGNPPELEAIAGPILRGGARHHIPTPATRALVAAIEPNAHLRA
jgi:2-dehydropantoate 2-reductase